MKKAIKINLNGIIFHIDEDAYEKLKNYLDTISRHFSDKEEASEIMNDIESRIAELFQEKSEKESQVINIEMVKEVIKIMGEPEDIISGAEETTSGSSGDTHSGYTRTGRRLYRDPENSVLGGVCSGLGAYFNADAIIFRILFVIFFFTGFASLIVYIILWIVLPKAETAAQKLEMRGEPVNISNIEKKIREEYDATKEKVKKAAQSEQVKKTKDAAGNFFSELGRVFLVFFKVILILIGTAFVISGIGIIIALISGTFVGINIFPIGHYDFSLGELLSPFSDPVNITFLVLSISLLVLIPVIAMIYALIKIIFSIKTHNRPLTIGAVTLWFVALIMFLGIFFIETDNYSSNGTSKSQQEIQINSDTIFLELNNKQKNEFDDELGFEFPDNSEWFITDDLDRIYGQVALDIEKTTGDSYQVEIEKKSRGKNWEDAENNAANINYSYKQTGTVLILDPYFFIKGDDKWRVPRVKITVKVPEKKYISLDRSTRNVLDDIYNVDYISDWNMAGKTWLMTDDGLELVED